jgi:hypothetical protein
MFSPTFLKYVDRPSSIALCVRMFGRVAPSEVYFHYFKLDRSYPAMSTILSAVGFALKSFRTQNVLLRLSN